jgi:metal-responsive CopG/Arc/MetJ family transcriptional regulator
MKTAVSLPDPVFHEAEQLARRLRVPRSRLYATAIASYVKQHRRKSITEALNEVYGDKKENSEVDPVLQKLQERSLHREKW